jgi:hypothetical protein
MKVGATCVVEGVVEWFPAERVTVGVIVELGIDDAGAVGNAEACRFVEVIEGPAAMLAPLAECGLLTTVVHIRPPVRR